MRIIRFQLNILYVIATGLIVIHNEFHLQNFTKCSSSDRHSSIAVRYNITNETKAEAFTLKMFSTITTELDTLWKNIKYLQDC